MREPEYSSEEAGMTRARTIVAASIFSLLAGALAPKGDLFPPPRKDILGWIACLRGV